MKNAPIEVDLIAPRLVLQNMKDFAKYLMHNVDAYTEEWLQQTRSYDTPLLRYLDQYSEDQLISIGRHLSIELLDSFIQDTSSTYIKNSVQRWIENQLPLIEQNQIAIDDVYLFPHIRKQTLLTFLSKYTQDPDLIISLVREIDAFTLAHTASSYKTFLKLIEDRMAVQVGKLAESENLFKQAQAITHIGNYVWDLKTNKLTWTDELYRIYDLEPGSVITNEQVASFRHPEDEQRIMKAVEHARESMTPFDFYYRIVLANGQQKTLRAKGQVIADENNNPVAIFGTAQDVTQQKQTEEDLLQNQLFIKKIADAAPSIIALYHIETQAFSFVNDGIKKLLGYDPEVVLRAGVSFILNLVHPEDIALLEHERSLAYEKGIRRDEESGHEAIAEFQYRMKHQNGEYRWFRTYGTIFDRDETQRALHVLNISIDITEQVEAEHILLQRSVELSQSNSRLEEYAFIASHDLKEPLRKITLFSDRLRKLNGDGASDEAKACVDKIFNSAQRLQVMVNDLLGISQVSGEKAFEQHDLEKLLKEVVMNLDHKIDELNAKVVTDQLPVARVIASQFHQLFLNLIGNSLKFFRADKTPEIMITHCFVAPDAVRHLKLSPSSQYLRINVTDNGIGFDNAFSEKVFGIFQRLHPRHVVEGNGMGLAICKKIIENHGGAIFADGREGDGATFTLIIPA